MLLYRLPDAQAGEGTLHFGAVGHLHRGAGVGEELDR